MNEADAISLVRNSIARRCLAQMGTTKTHRAMIMRKATQVTFIAHPDGNPVTVKPEGRWLELPDIRRDVESAEGALHAEETAFVGLLKRVAYQCTLQYLPSDFIESEIARAVHPIAAYGYKPLHLIVGKGLIPRVLKFPSFVCKPGDRTNSEASDFVELGCIQSMGIVVLASTLAQDRSPIGDEEAFITCDPVSLGCIASPLELKEGETILTMAITNDRGVQWLRRFDGDGAYHDTGVGAVFHNFDIALIAGELK